MLDFRAPTFGNQVSADILWLSIPYTFKLARYALKLRLSWRITIISMRYFSQTDGSILTIYHVACWW